MTTTKRNICLQPLQSNFIYYTDFSVHVKYLEDIFLKKIKKTTVFLSKLPFYLDIMNFLRII